jgi:hypothetical protein
MAGAPAADERGLSRADGVDIGAFESQGFTLTIEAGDNQRVTFHRALPTLLSVRVAANNPLEPVHGGRVTFTAPATGPGGAFPGPSGTVSVAIGANGIATAPTFITNHIFGPFTITAVTNGANAVTFHEMLVPPKLVHQPAPAALVRLLNAQNGQAVTRSPEAGAGAPQAGNGLTASAETIVANDKEGEGFSWLGARELAMQSVIAPSRPGRLSRALWLLGD